MRNVGHPFSERAKPIIALPSAQVALRKIALAESGDPVTPLVGVPHPITQSRS
jgi:hypothetical protein